MVYLDIALLTTIQPGGLCPHHLLHMIREESLCRQLCLVRLDSLSENILNFGFPVIWFWLSLTVLGLDSFLIFASLKLIYVDEDDLRPIDSLLTLALCSWESEAAGPRSCWPDLGTG